MQSCTYLSNNVGVVLLTPHLNLECDLMLLLHLVKVPLHWVSVQDRQGRVEEELSRSAFCCEDGRVETELRPDRLENFDLLLLGSSCRDDDWQRCVDESQGCWGRLHHWWLPHFKKTDCTVRCIASRVFKHTRKKKLFTYSSLAWCYSITI